jgi:hypothetical protein
MAATLSLDTLTSGGSGITVLAGKTLTVEGVSVTAGSSNIQRATTDVTIGTTAGYEVAGKSEVVVAANAASSNRTITLPAVGAVGMSTCIITVVADADATSTYALKVQDAGSTEVWTGYQKNDFVRLIVSNSLWVVLDHKETMFSSRSLTADQSIAASATAKVIGWTNVTDIGQVWDDANNKLVSPFAGIWDLNWRIGLGSVTGAGTVPVLYSGGAMIYSPSQGADGSGYSYGMNMSTLRIKVAASTDIEFYAHNIYSIGPYSVGGNGSNESGFDGTFTRTY